MNDPIPKKIWSTAFTKEFDKRTGEKGTNSINVMSHDEIREIPKDGVVTYASIVVVYRLQKTTQIWFA